MQNETGIVSIYLFNGNEFLPKLYYFFMYFCHLALKLKAGTLLDALGPVQGSHAKSTHL